MKKIETPLPDLYLVELPVYRDDRGFFTERYSAKKFRDLGLPHEFVQDNHSESRPGVIRGLHYQHSPAQGKLVSCLSGRIFDVAVDVRAGSPTFGKWFGVELTAENGKVLWIPGGFAHGFSVLGQERATVLYKVDQTYSPQTEGGIRFDDPDLGIDWQVTAPILAKKDTELPSFATYAKSPAFTWDRE